MPTISVIAVLTAPDGQPIPHWVAIAFLFALGSCIGSFLNVVVWRLPRGESLSTPPSHCPRCNNRLKWYDNIPILGWLKLRGRCRFCREPISVRYPIVEAVTALLFVFFYVMYYVVGVGPCPPVPALRWADVPGSAVYRPPDVPILLLHVFLVSALLAASLIDAERYEIPQKITAWVAAVGVVAHAIFDDPTSAGALNLVRADGSPSPAAALAAGGTVGLALSLLLLRTGRLKRSFPDGEPLLEVEREAAEAENAKLKREGKRLEELAEIPPPYTRRQIAAEMRKEMAFLLVPMAMAVGWWAATAYVGPLGAAWDAAVRHHPVSGLLGALLGGLVGGLVVWVVRILGTLAFGRVAMGLGDADLMFAVGTVVGAGAATVAFFLAPFFGLLLAVYMLATGQRKELPYGPYLSLASAAVLLVYCPIAAWLEPGMSGLALVVRQLLGGGAV